MKLFCNKSYSQGYILVIKSLVDSANTDIHRETLPPSSPVRWWTLPGHGVKSTGPRAEIRPVLESAGQDASIGGCENIVSEKTAL